MLPKPSTSPSCFAKTTHYRLCKQQWKQPHRDNGKSDRVVWIKTKKKRKVWLKPCLLACTKCSVCVGVRAGTITGTVKSATIVYWKLKEAVIRYFIPAWKLWRRNLCFTKDVPALHKRQPARGQQTESPPPWGVPTPVRNDALTRQVDVLTRPGQGRASNGWEVEVDSVGDSTFVHKYGYLRSH